MPRSETTTLRRAIAAKAQRRERTHSCALLSVCARFSCAPPPARVAARLRRRDRSRSQASAPLPLMPANDQSVKM
eukprot:2791073-Pleurochrysis_carterae.AAC.2